MSSVLLAFLLLGLGLPVGATGESLEGSCATPQQKALELAAGSRKSIALSSFVQTGLAAAMDKLCGKDGGTMVNAADVAAAAGLHPVAVFRILRFLATFGVVVQSEGPSEPKFALGEIGKVLTPSHPQSVGRLILWEAGPMMHAVWGGLPSFLHSNAKVFPSVFDGQEFWDYLHSHPEDMKIFQGAMTGHGHSHSSALSTPELSPTLDLTPYKVVCDLGCGEGHLARALSKRFPEAHYVVADKPHVIARIDPAGLPTNFSTAAVDFFVSVPEAHAYVLKFIIHDWDDAHGARILASIRKSNSSARVFVYEYGPMPGPNVPHISKMFDLQMGVLFSAKERTQEEYDALWEESGYERVATHLISGGSFPMHVQELAVPARLATQQ